MLRRGAWFGRLPARLQALILSFSTVRSYRQGEVVVREGEPGKGMGAVLDGQVHLLRRVGDEPRYFRPFLNLLLDRYRISGVRISGVRLDFPATAKWGQRDPNRPPRGTGGGLNDDDSQSTQPDKVGYQRLR